MHTYTSPYQILVVVKSLRSKKKSKGKGEKIKDNKKKKAEDSHCLAFLNLQAAHSFPLLQIQTSN